jgi:hypothetical protein
MDVGGTAQIHLMGVEGMARFARGSPGRGEAAARCGVRPRPLSRGAAR